MEKAFFDWLLAAFIDFHRAVGLIVMLCLLLWLMSGRRLDPGAYTNAFLKTLLWFFKRLFKACEGAAKGTAAQIPTKHAHWRPLAHAGAQLCYTGIALLIMISIVSRCAQYR